jgi:heme-degrading monooxygenase HmoA
MRESTVGFVVIYRWKLHAGMEHQFQQAWERATPLLMRHRGALGSRLHKGEDGTWVAYAQWPSRQSWERSRASPAVDPEASRQMLEAEAESFAPILLAPVADFLSHDAIVREP